MLLILSVEELDIDHSGVFVLGLFCICIVFCIPGYICEFSKHYLCLNVFVSLLALYINVAASLQYALGQWVKQWSVANISVVSACVIVSHYYGSIHSSR